LALCWPQELIKKNGKLTASMCCSHGKVYIEIEDVPEKLQQLLYDDISGPYSHLRVPFMNYIRRFNNAMQVRLRFKVCMHAF
jgi:hypothetical protein